jgi:hypothetical protein
MRNRDCKHISRAEIKQTKQRKDQVMVKQCKNQTEKQEKEQMVIRNRAKYNNRYEGRNHITSLVAHGCKEKVNVEAIGYKDLN